MRIPTYRFDRDVTLYVLSDSHRADFACDVALWKRSLKEIEADKQAKVLTLGDLYNCAIWGSKSDPTQSLTTAQENLLLMKELEPIADQIIGMIPGNHEERLQKTVGYNLTQGLALHLHAPYFDGLTVFCIICGRCAYYIAAGHGIGGGKKQGRKLDALIEFGELIGGCDLYIEGHSHAPFDVPGLIPYVDKKRGIISYQPTTYVSGGHFLEWSKSYARNKKYKPKPKGMQRITLCANNSGNLGNKKVKVELFN